VRTLGKIGQALEFDGGDDMVDASSPSTLDDIRPITVSLWAYPQTAGEGNSARLVAKDLDGATVNRWQFKIDNTGSPHLMVLSFEKDETTDLERFSDNGFVTLNEWQHFVMTWDGSTNASNAHLYRNGIEATYQQTQNADSINSDGAHPLIIGNSQNGIRTMDGFLDDVRIYNRALSLDEVKRLYQMGR
jgi:hypothetical protein